VDFFREVVNLCNIPDLINAEPNYIPQMFDSLSPYMSDMLHGTNDRWLFSRDTGEVFFGSVVNIALYCLGFFSA